MSSDTLPDDSVSSDRADLMDRCVQLLEDAEVFIDAAIWAAGKLNVEMCLRHSMPSWRELEGLVAKREAMREWRDRFRALEAARSALAGGAKT